MTASAPKKLAEQRIGSLFDGKWTLDSLLGTGGSAAVYAATHRNGKRAAIKILHAHCAAEDHLVARFVREGYLANKIGHSGVVSVLDDDKAEDGSVYLVMELLEGVSLDRHGRGLAPPLEVAHALQVADDLLSILVAAHGKGLVHRDIKPANLFLTKSGELKILDFGIARLAEGVVGEGQATQTGMLMGTPAFMPPEQARGRWHDVDTRSDIWAVGASLIALMTGRRPRSAETPAEELLAAMTAPLPSLAVFVPGAPPGLVELIDRAVAFERNDRWQSAAEMQAVTRNVAKALEASPFRASTTLALAQQHSSTPDLTPQPLLPNQPYVASTMLTPHGQGIPPGAVSEPELPQGNTKHGYMRSNAPSRGAAVERTSSGVGAAVAAVFLSLVVVGAIATGVLYMRAQKARTDAAAAATAVVTGTAPATANAVPPPAAVNLAPPHATAVASTVASTSTSSSTSTSTPTPTPTPTTTTTSTATAATTGRARGAGKPKGVDAGADPNKIMDSRF